MLENEDLVEVKLPAEAINSTQLDLIVLPQTAPTLPIQQLQQTTYDSSGDVARIISMGASSMLVAVHLIGNNVILASLGEAEQSAVSLITSIQNVSSGIIFGILLNTGVEIGPAMANKNNKQIGAIIKTSWAIGISSGLVLTGVLLLLPKILPHVVSLDTAEATSSFFNMFAIGGSIAEPLIASNGIIISLLERNLDGRSWKSWGIQLGSMISYRAPALGLGYVLAKRVGMGPAGVGLGTSIAAISALIGTQVWFSRNAYKEYELYVMRIPDFKSRLKSFLAGGWRLSLRRLSEWGNLAAISLLIGSWSNSALRSFSPFSQANTLIGLGLQGMSQGAMVFIGRDAAKQRQSYEEFKKTFSIEKLEEYSTLLNKNRIAFHKNNLAGLVLTILLSGIIYLARNPIIQLFISSKEASDDYDLAECFLMYGLIGLFPDALRIISSGVLGAWNDILYPTIASIIAMTAFGVGLGGIVVWKENKNNLLPLLWFRIAGMFVSALINYYRFLQIYMKNDNKAYLNGRAALDMLHLIENWELIANTEPESQIVNQKQFFELICLQLENNECTQESLKKMVALDLVTRIENYTTHASLDKKEFLYNLSHFMIKNNKLILNLIVESLTNILKIEIIVIDEKNKIAAMTSAFKLDSTENKEKIYLKISETGYSIPTEEQIGIARGDDQIILKSPLIFSNIVNKKRTVDIELHEISTAKSLDFDKEVDEANESDLLLESDLKNKKRNWSWCTVI